MQENPSYAIYWQTAFAEKRFDRVGQVKRHPATDSTTNGTDDEHSRLVIFGRANSQILGCCCDVFGLRDVFQGSLNRITDFLEMIGKNQPTQRPQAFC